MFDSKLDDLEVVHEDAHLLALVKPAGLLAVPGRGSDKADCLITRAHQRWPDALVVHRLDHAGHPHLHFEPRPADQSRGRGR